MDAFQTQFGPAGQRYDTPVRFATPDQIAARDRRRAFMAKFAIVRALPSSVVDDPGPIPVVEPRRGRRAGVVIGIVARHFKIDPADILGQSRAAWVATPRQIAMYLLAKTTQLSTVQVAQAFNRDHSTFVHARDKYRALQQVDPAIREVLCVLEIIILGDES